MEITFLKDISQDNIGRSFHFRGRVEVIRQTGGPTLMIINDGTSSFTFKAFLRPGARAYPEIDIGDLVEGEAVISKRKEGIEGEVKEMKKLQEKDIKEFRDKLDSLAEDKIKALDVEFTIKSDALEKLRPRFLKVATEIRRAIVEGRPIILRHNADCDGYSSAITIERAILKLMDEVSGGDKILQYQNYKRAPSKAPFYEYEDAIKDLSMYLKDKIKNGAKDPLIIITDNGSTEEDILSMKHLKLHGADIVVVDHHYPGEIKNGKVLVDEFLNAHLNPYLEGFNSNICTGMLGFELARFIHENPENSVMIPAMSAILDHTAGTEREQYIEKAKAKGYSEKYLSILGEIIDMQSHFLRFMEAREFVDDLICGDRQRQEKIVEMLGSELERRYDAVMKVARNYSLKEDFGPFYLISFDGEKGTYRGDYPAIGKSTNHIHKTFEEELEKPIITMTYGSTFMTIRVSDEILNISIPVFAKSVIEKMPYTNADGGGHERAGSVKFVEYARDDVIELFKQYLREVAKKQ